jgi:hypothetical protein
MLGCVIFLLKAIFSLMTGVFHPSQLEEEREGASDFIEVEADGETL